MVKESGMGAYGIIREGKGRLQRGIGRPRRPVTLSEEAAFYEQKYQGFFLNTACHASSWSARTHQPCFLSCLVFRFSYEISKRLPFGHERILSWASHRTYSHL